MKLRKVSAAAAAALVLSITATACGGDGDSDSGSGSSGGDKIKIGIKYDQPGLGLKEPDGNFSGFDIWLEDKDAGTIDIVSNMVCRRLAVRDVGFEEMRIDLGGLGRCLRVYRLPDRNDTWRITHTQTCKIRPGVDNPLYVRLTQEDGHQAWSSPIYVIP